RRRLALPALRERARAPRRARRALLVLRSHLDPRGELRNARGLEPLARRPMPRPEEPPPLPELLPNLLALARTEGRAPARASLPEGQGRRVRAEPDLDPRSGPGSRADP